MTMPGMPLYRKRMLLLRLRTLLPEALSSARGHSCCPAAPFEVHIQQCANRHLEQSIAFPTDPPVEVLRFGG
jgi:hypothetical protein